MATSLNRVTRRGSFATWRFALQVSQAKTMREWIWNSLRARSLRMKRQCLRGSACAAAPKKSSWRMYKLGVNGRCGGQV
eukprot:4221664-Karenia_brevis.AAC.1